MRSYHNHPVIAKSLFLKKAPLNIVYYGKVRYTKLNILLLYDLAAQKLISLTESCDLCQYVTESTHLNGHILDLVFARSTDNMVLGCQLSEALSDHSQPVRPKKTAIFRKLKDIDMDSFTSDLLVLPLFTKVIDDIEQLVDWYNNGLRYVLDKHAPVQKRIFMVRPDNPRNSGDISTARRYTRKLERRWKRTRLAIDKEILMELMRDQREMITIAKQTFLNTKIAELTDKRSIFKIVDSLLLKKTGIRLPAHDDLPTLLQRFGDFFIGKVNKIRTSLPSVATNPATDLPVTSRIFNAFSPITAGEVVSIITSSPTNPALRI